MMFDVLTFGYRNGRVYTFLFNESQIEIEQAKRFCGGNSVFNENTNNLVFSGSNN